MSAIDKDRQFGVTSYKFGGAQSIALPDLRPYVIFSCWERSSNGLWSVAIVR